MHRYATRPRQVLLALSLAAAVATPASGYRFIGNRFASHLVGEIHTSETSAKWRASEFPLRFRLVENEQSNQQNFTWEEIRDELERSVAGWNAISTSEVQVILEREPAAGDGNAIGDGLNTVAFRDESFGQAYWLFDGDGRIIECDIHLAGNRLRLEPPDRPFVPSASFEHEIGHCLGLAHTEPHPMPSVERNGALSTLLPGFQQDPLMSYGPGWIGLTVDDEVAVSLLYPAPGFHTSRGAVSGTVLVADGAPAVHAYVQAVERGDGGPRAGPGAFTDENGRFLLEGLEPGPVMLWVHPLLYRIYSCHPGLWPGAEASGSLDFLDEWHWADVERGRTTSLAEPIRVSADPRPRVVERAEPGQ